MWKTYSLDFYTAKNQYSFPFGIDTNVKNFDECICKVYLTLFKQLFNEFNDSASIPLSINIMFECFDIYLNEIVNNEPIPVLVSVEDDVKEALWAADMKFAAPSANNFLSLNEIIRKIDKEALQSNQGRMHLIDTLKLVWINWVVPKWLQDFSGDTVRFKIFRKPDYMTLSTDIIFDYYNHSINKYFKIMFNSKDWINLLYYLPKEIDNCIANLLPNVAAWQQQAINTLVYSGGRMAGKTVSLKSFVSNTTFSNPIEIPDLFDNNTNGLTKPQPKTAQELMKDNELMQKMQKRFSVANPFKISEFDDSIDAIGTATNLLKDIYVEGKLSNIDNIKDAISKTDSAKKIKGD